MIDPLDRREYMAPGLDEIANKIEELRVAVNTLLMASQDTKELRPGVTTHKGLHGSTIYRLDGKLIKSSEAFV